VIRHIFIGATTAAIGVTLRFPLNVLQITLGLLLMANGIVAFYAKKQNKEEK
jgi:hypothetical protein